MKGINCLRTLSRPHAFEPLRIEGDIPRNLSGTLYRVGVGQFESFGTPNKHWFDGEGAVIAGRFENGKVSGAARLLDVTPKTDQDHNTITLGRFGTAPKSVWGRIQATWNPHAYANAANTALLSWADQLYALYEGGLPTEVDPETLKAQGQSTLDGTVRRSFSAHPKSHPQSQRILNFGFRILPRPSLDVYALEADGTSKVLGSVPYNGATFVHDFAVTENHFIFIISPVFANPYDMIIRGRSLAECLKWNPKKGTEILVGSLKTGKLVFRAETDSFFFTHTANAYEFKNEIIVDIISYKDGANLQWMNSIMPAVHEKAPVSTSTPGFLTRLKIDLHTKKLSLNPLSNEVCEVPQVNPQESALPHRFIVAAGFKDPHHAYNDLYDALVIHDTHSEKTSKLDFGAHQFVSEALFQTTPSPSDLTYLVTANYDARLDRTYFAVCKLLDGQASLLGKAWFDQALPFTFHGVWKQ